MSHEKITRGGVRRRHAPARATCPLASANDLHGSRTGCGWNAKVEVIGHLSDGRDVTLVNSGDMRIGDNNAFDLRFNFGRIQ
ncbi:MAG: hypothetical protein SFV54_25475 [Bryobacteraceae bacterium]|nr:hypothetical protein [Bryobacteraceae bacterium]